MKHNHTPDTLQSKDDRQLQNLLANAQRLGAGDVARMVQEELARRAYGDELPRSVSVQLEAA